MPAWTYQFLAFFGESGITNGTCAILVLMFIYGLRDKRFGRVCPSLMTSLGILGTFCGIYLSLYPLDFSPGNMNNSVTQLLGGMRTAFFTSLAGIAFSIAFKVTERMMSPKNIDDIIKNKMTPEQQLVIDNLESIRQAISGESNSNILTELQYIRYENREAFLKFGKTLKEFNKATQAIKKWQEENREHIIQLTKAFDMSARAIGTIARNCETILATMANLSDVMKVLGREVRQLQHLLESFAELGNQAKEAFPLIKKHLDKIGEVLENSAKGFSDLDKRIQEIFEQAHDSIKVIADKHLENVGKIAKAMTDEVTEESKKSSLQIQKLVEKTVEEFGGRISNESLRIAREYGENMISIAEQCAKLIERSAKGGNDDG